jgi:hypothetical protein
MHSKEGLCGIYSWLGKKQEGLCSANSFKKTTKSMNTWKIHCRNPNLGLATKEKGSQGRGPRRMWEWRFTLPIELSFWELESRWIPEPSESNRRGQNTSHWRVIYIIGNLLKCKCLKWAHMTRLDICNTSYGKKKGRESNWLFDSRPQKFGNWPDFRVYRWNAIHRWKALDESYNFASDLILIGGLSKQLWPRKVAGV